MKKISFREYIDRLSSEERDKFARDIGFKSGWRALRHVVSGKRGTPLSRAKKIVHRSGGRVDIYSIVQD